MTRPFEVEISESQEELEKALKHAVTASSKGLPRNKLSNLVGWAT
ncbi:hypothetical protein [Nostoc sp.]